VRRLRRKRAEPRWVFTTEVHDLGGETSAVTFLGPVYRPGDHDSREAVQALACAWWRRQQQIERPRMALVRRLAPPD